VQRNPSARAPCTSDEQPNHRDLDQCFACLHLSLVIFTQASIARDPGERAFHDPSSGQDAEPTRAWSTLDHLQIPVALSKTKLCQLLTPIGGVGPDLFQAWQERGKSGKQASGTATIMQVGRGNIARSAAGQVYLRGCVLGHVSNKGPEVVVQRIHATANSLIDRFFAHLSTTGQSCKDGEYFCPLRELISCFLFVLMTCLSLLVVLLLHLLKALKLEMSKLLV